MRFSKKAKIACAAAIFMIFGSAGAFGFGIGLQVGGGFAEAGRFGGALLLSGARDKHFAISLGVGDNYFNVGGSLDWWVFQPVITKLGPGSLKFFVGPGLGVNVGAANDDLYFGAAVRFPLGLDYDIAKFDIFLQAAPFIGLNINPFHIPTWGVDGALGFRFWVS